MDKLPEVVVFGPGMLAIVEALVAAMPGEVLWNGLATIQDGEIVLSDLYVPRKQLVTTASVDAPDAIAEYVEHHPNADVSTLRYFGHSHAGMSTFFSSVDDDNIKRQLALGDPKSPTWMVSTVHNKKREVTARLDVYVPGFGAFSSPLKVAVRHDALDAYVEKIAHEIAEYNEKEKAARIASRDWPQFDFRGLARLDDRIRSADYAGGSYLANHTAWNRERRLAEDSLTPVDAKTAASEREKDPFFADERGVPARNDANDRETRLNRLLRGKKSRHV